MGLKKIISEKNIVVICGTGGVGKTSISAALALGAAKTGRRVGLITIDPAKRLASALGLSDIKSEPQDLYPFLASEMPELRPGQLAAMMFDSAATLDNFVLSTGGTALLQKMRESSIYQIIAQNFSGTHEYLALEKLFELHSSAQFDLIILDTPPARHTLDFLDAPQKIATFFDDRIFQWFITSPRDSSLLERLRARGTRSALALLEKLTGEGVIRDFTRIAPHLYELKTKFIERQGQMQSLLKSPRAGALFVGTGSTLPQREFHSFWEDAVRRDLRPLGLVVNRSLAFLAPGKLSGLHTDSGQIPAPYLLNYENILSLAVQENANIAAARKELGKEYPIVRVPELSQNVSQVAGLLEIAPHLFAERAPERD